MKIFKSIRILSIILIFVFCFFKLKNLNSTFFTNKFFVVYDSLFSQEIISEVKEFINKNFIKKSLKKSSKILLDKFSIIKNVKFQKNHIDFFTITINSEAPLYLINDNFIFSQNGKIFSKYFFKNENIENLEKITLNTEIEKLDNQTKNFLKNIYDELSQEYKISWENHNLVKLKNKNQNFTIITTDQFFPDKNTLEICKKINNEFSQNQNIKGTHEVIMDLRFSKQIVVSIKGG